MIDLSLKQQKLPLAKKVKTSPKNREPSPKGKEVGERVTLYTQSRMKTYD